MRDTSRANSPGVLLIDLLKECAESSGKVWKKRERGKWGGVVLVVEEVGLSFSLSLSVETILNNERF